MDKKQKIAIFTTASLPWMTGTAVNPLFRAAFLAKEGNWKVTLVIPWLSQKDQVLVYPNGVTFSSPRDQEIYVRQWVEERSGFASSFDIHFYPGKFSTDKRSILAVGDISQIIPDEEADIAVLEEPEHLTWYHHGRRWKTKFHKVIGVVHTNYLEYVRREKHGHFQAFFLKYINNWVVDIYCHKVIRLSAATQELPRSVVCNVHGVNPRFIKIGKTIYEKQLQGQKVFTRGAYYIGKMIWNKGYRELLQLLERNQNMLTDLQIDLYGSGEDSDQVKQAAKKLKLKINVYPGRDHADPLFHEYKIFINPSTTDVLCTTTTEALAMGKTVICANHSSNDFFKQFTNCHTYDSDEEFVATTLIGLKEDPVELTDEDRHNLSWEAATERFIEASEISHKPTNQKEKQLRRQFMSMSLREGLDLKKKMEDASAYLHYTASGLEGTRLIFGAIPGSLEPDEEQCKELGLEFHRRKRSFSFKQLKFSS